MFSLNPLICIDRDILQKDVHGIKIDQDADFVVYRNRNFRRLVSDITATENGLSSRKFYRECPPGICSGSQPCSCNRNIRENERLVRCTVTNRSSDRTKVLAERGTRNRKNKGDENSGFHIWPSGVRTGSLLCGKYTKYSFHSPQSKNGGAVHRLLSLPLSA